MFTSYLNIVRKEACRYWGVYSKLNKHILFIAFRHPFGPFTERFHSRAQLNSHRIGLTHQQGGHFIVLGHQYVKTLYTSMNCVHFIWRHSSHVSAPRQWNGGHISEPNNSCGIWNISLYVNTFLCCNRRFAWQPCMLRDNENILHKKEIFSPRNRIYCSCQATSLPRKTSINVNENVLLPY